MTEIIYYINPDLIEFEADLVSVKKTADRLTIVLNRTAFYPEGGGQPADKGTINGFEVLDVRKKDGEIYHILNTADSDGTNMPEEGDKAVCIIDSEHRFDYMQQHSGQHVISAAMMKIAGIETVSVHQGTEFTAVETSADVIPGEVITKIEDEANAVVRSDTAITAEWTDSAGLERYNLRRPSKHSSNIRIINIPGIDCAACGGMHLKRTSDIGLIKFTHQEKIRGHIRTFWKIGKRAYKDYAEKTSIINSLTEMHSARQFELIDKITAVDENYSDLKYNYAKLEEEYAEVYASVLISEAAAVIKVFENKSRGFIGSLLKTLSMRSSRPSFIFNRNEKSLTWAVAVPAETDFDFNSFKKDFLPLIDGKGGGRPPLWQGAAGNPDGLDDFIDKLKSSRF